MRRYFKAHPVTTEHKEPGCADGFPDLATRRDAFRHNFLERKLYSKHSTGHSNSGSDFSSKVLVEFVRHLAAAHLPRRLAHVGGQAGDVADGGKDQTDD